MGFKEVLKANLSLLQVSPLTFIAGVLLAFTPPYILLLSIVNSYRGLYFRSTSGLAESLEAIQEPRGETLILPIDILGSFTSWAIAMLLVALVLNIVSESSLRRQVDYAIAYTGSPIMSLAIVSLSLLLLTLPQLTVMGVGFALIHYTVLGWDIRTSTISGLYMIVAILTLGLLFSTLTSYIRASHRYWVIVIAMTAAIYVIILAEPDTVKLLIPLIGFIEYLEKGGLANLIAPIAVYLAPIAIPYTLIRYRR